MATAAVTKTGTRRRVGSSLTGSRSLSSMAGQLSLVGTSLSTMRRSLSRNRTSSISQLLSKARDGTAGLTLHRTDRTMQESSRFPFGEVFVIAQRDAGSLSGWQAPDA